MNVKTYLAAIEAHAQAILAECEACEGQTDSPSQEVFSRLDIVSVRAREIRREAQQARREIALAEAEVNP